MASFAWIIIFVLPALKGVIPLTRDKVAGTGSMPGTNKKYIPEIEGQRQAKQVMKSAAN